MGRRTVSALVVILILIALIFFLGDLGLFAWCSLVAARCAAEYGRLAFNSFAAPKHIKISFWLMTMVIFAVTVWFEVYAVAAIAVSAILFLTMCLILIHRQTDLLHALRIQGVGLMGFIYAGVFPALATKTIQLDGGARWLYSLLFIVFLGDTLAYLVGRKFGKRKLLPAVSPNKTVEGAIGGLIGSTAGGLIMSYFFVSKISLWILLSTALVTGIFAQMGDLFESLMKRVAEVKDSGSIMPGHGGALDRVDGVFFGAPIYYVLFKFFIG